MWFIICDIGLLIIRNMLQNSDVLCNKLDLDKLLIIQKCYCYKVSNFLRK
jgi:hypothetical protein